MELLLAGAAALLGQGVVGAVDHREADHTILYSLEALIHVVLPQRQALHYAAILNTNTHLHFLNRFILLFFSDTKKHIFLKPPSACIS